MLTARVSNDSPQLVEANEQPSLHKPPRFIRAEVNLLRLPLFALQTKGLRNLDGFECTGRFQRRGEAHDYSWRVTRHSTRSYPGTLARSAHQGFLSILSEQGPPFSNPVSWTWYDLCRRIGVSLSGRTVQRLKEAIRATHGLVIEMSGAIYSRASGELIALNEDDRHLYSRVRFYSSKNQEGNAVWLSQWYLDSLNAHYTAPLDHELWRFLDTRSPIASRLYEYLLPNFYGPAPYLRFNYPRLAQSLPIRVERYFSNARKQMDPALRLLDETHVLGRVQWARSKQGLAQLYLHRGSRLKQPPAGLPLSQASEVLDQTFELHELRTKKIPEHALVVEYYRLRFGEGSQRPTEKELTVAKAILESLGHETARGMLPYVAKLMKERFPDGKTFGAVQPYVADAAQLYRRQQTSAQQRRTERLRERESERRLADSRRAQQDFESHWEPQWNQLTRFQQHEIQASILARKAWLKRMPSVLHSECLRELAKQRNGSQPGARTAA